MKHFTRINTLVLFLLCLFVNTVHASTITALWDFQNMNPSSLSGIKIEGTETHVASSNSSINMFVIAKSGKFAVRTSDVQMNANTYLRIPVQSTKDVITIVSYPGYHNYTINGTAATANTTTHTATASEVTQGYVQVQATSTTYLYSIKLVQAIGLDDANQSIGISRVSRISALLKPTSPRAIVVKLVCKKNLITRFEQEMRMILVAFTHTPILSEMLSPTVIVLDNIRPCPSIPATERP